MKIKKVCKITDFRHLNLYSIFYTDRMKADKQWIFASRSTHSNPLSADADKPDAVVIVPFFAAQKKLVLIREFRVALGDFQYGFPAGLVDENEDIETAARRELFEETGLKITKLVRKSPAVFSSSGMTDESVSLVFVECSGQPTSQFNEASEEIQVVLVSQNDARDLLADDTLKFDVKTWIVLNQYAVTGSV